jgi:hypothetical protein
LLHIKTRYHKFLSIKKTGGMKMGNGEKSGMHDQGEARLCLVMAESRMTPLFLILQQGFLLRVHVGCSLNMFLTEQIGLSPEYIMEKIQTIFLDGRPVDDLHGAIIKDGSSVALSAAMPGLVGAAMRRGGIYSTLRDSITYQETGNQGVLREGTVHIKLFNLLMKDLGPRFLKQGILLPVSDFADFISKRSEAFWLGCKCILLNEKFLARDLLLKEECLSQYAMVHLSVRTAA